MKKLSQYYEITGDPPTDIGGFGLKFFAGSNPELDLIGLIESAAKIYVNNWNAGINSFYLNSKITQPAFSDEAKLTETTTYFRNLLEDNLEHKHGICRITGKNANLFPVGREAFIMAGSGTFLNFHHGLESGIYLSKEAIIRNFFLPLSAQYLGDKIALIYSNYPELTELFATNNCKKNTANLAKDISKGVLKSEFNNPSNALFEFAEKCIEEAWTHTNAEDVTLNLYHFTNFGAGPTVDLYTFPARLFKFYQRCLAPEFRSDWTKFLYAHYKPNINYKNPRFNSKTSIFEVEVKKNKMLIDHSQYKIWRNRIYDSLLKGVSILPYFLDWSKANKLQWSIVMYYQIYLRNMNPKTLQKIEEIAEFIIRDTDALKRNITRINSFKRGSDLREYLIKLATMNYRQANQEPLITVTDYVEYLFPEGSFWSDIRNLLLIAMYQKLHSKELFLDIDEPEMAQSQSDEEEPAV